MEKGSGYHRFSLAEAQRRRDEREFILKTIASWRGAAAMRGRTSKGGGEGGGGDKRGGNCMSHIESFLLPR